MLFPQCLQHAHAVDDRHLDVKQDEVHPSRRHPSHRTGTVFGLHDGEFLVFKDHPDSVADGLFIISDEDSFHG